MASMDNPKFSFRFVSLNETLNVVNRLKPKKASKATDIPVKDAVSFHFFHNFNNALSSCSFPTALKYGRHLKRMLKLIKRNYRPISILPNFSKVYKRLIFDQMYPFWIKYI